MSRDEDRDERPKRSWAEIDRLRDRPRARRDTRTTRDPADIPGVREAAQRYLKQAEGFDDELAESAESALAAG